MTPVAASDKALLTRFSVADGAPRAMSPPPEELSEEYPFTLDLRQRNR
jgi:hypothetical protein